MAACLTAIFLFFLSVPQSTTSGFANVSSCGARNQLNGRCNQEIMVQTALLKVFWNAMNLIGIRRITRLVKCLVPAYKDTTFFLDGANVESCVALTIDDGLCRGATERCLVPRVLQLLKAHDAHATFFVCTKYTSEEDANQVLRAGHELGNHLGEDLSGYYCRLDRVQFEKEFKSANDYLDKIDGGVSDGRWFRAPQGVMNGIMREVATKYGSRHALGDAYCDDWAFASSRGCDVIHVAPLMLRQIHKGGSIAIFHMPEDGFRDACFDALEAFVKGAAAKGIRCMTLSELSRLAEESGIETKK